MADYLITLDTGDRYLLHHGTKGMHWGVWNEETAARYAGGKKVFVSGSSKTQSKRGEDGKKNPYYRRKLPKEVRRELDRHMKSNDKILVGDAPGIDRQVQDYLNKRKYKEVEVFSPGESRYLANKNWKNTKVKVPGSEPGSKEWLAGKDKKMTDLADEGLAVTITDGASATRNNISRLATQGKPTLHYEISNRGKRKDAPVETSGIKSATENLRKNPALMDTKYGKTVVEYYKTLSNWDPANKKDRVGVEQANQFDLALRRNALKRNASTETIDARMDSRYDFLNSKSKEEFERKRKRLSK